MSKCPVCGKDDPSCENDGFAISVDKLNELDVMSQDGECRNLQEVLFDYIIMLDYKKKFEQLLDYKKKFEQLREDYLQRNKEIERLKALKTPNIAYQQWLNTPLLEDINSSDQKERYANLSRYSQNLANTLLQANKTIQALKQSLQDRDNYVQELELVIKQKKPDNNIKSFGLETIPEVRVETTIDKKKTSPFPVVSEMTGGLNRKSHIKEPKKLIQPLYQKERSKNKKIVKNPMITSMMTNRARASGK